MKRFKEWLKRQNMKKVIRGFVAIVALALIVFMTLATLGIRREIDWLEWLGNVMILVGIAVFFLLLGESSGYDKQKEKPNGLYQVNLKDYNDKLKEIEDIEVYFPQFYAWNSKLQHRDKKIRFLTNNKVDERKAEKIIDFCSYSDYYTLCNSKITKFENPDNPAKVAIIHKLEEHEKFPVEVVLKGQILFNSPSASYYLTPFGTADDLELFEKPKAIQEDIKTNKKSNRAIKISSGIVISFIWAFLTVNEILDGKNVEMWMNLISRLLMALTSFLSGWLSSVITVKLEAELLKSKFDALVMFQTSFKKKLFECYTPDQMDAKDLEEYEEEQRKAKENVVIPEVVNQDEQPEQIPQQEPKLIEGGK